MICTVFTGKCGLKKNWWIFCRAIKRSISSHSYSILFLMPLKAIIGGLLPVSLKIPPSRIRKYVNLTRVRASTLGITLCERDPHSGCRNRTQTRVSSPSLPVRVQIKFKSPGVARLVVQQSIALRDQGRPHELIGLEVFKRHLTAAGLDTFANIFNVEASIDDKMGDMDVLRSKLARHQLGHNT